MMILFENLLKRKESYYFTIIFLTYKSFSNFIKKMSISNENN